MKRKRGRPKKMEMNRDMREFFGTRSSLGGASSTTSPPVKKWKDIEDKVGSEQEVEEEVMDRYGEREEEEGSTDDGEEQENSCDNVNNVYTWMKGIQEAEIKMRGMMRNCMIEWEKKMERWWESKIGEIREELRDEEEERISDGIECDKMMKECREMMKEMRRRMSRDWKEWEEKYKNMQLRIDKIERTEAEKRKSRKEIIQEIQKSDMVEERRRKRKKGQRGDTEAWLQIETGRRREEEQERGGDESESLRYKMERGKGEMIRADENNNDRYEEEKGDIMRIARRRPIALNEYEWREEKNRRENRRNNICISYTEKEGAGREKTMERIECGCKLDIRGQTTTKYIGRGIMVIKFRNWSDKMELMRRKGELKGTEIWIKDDMTRREKEVQRWIWEVEENERRHGRQVGVKYMKVCLDGEWWKWNERKGEIQKYGEGEKRWQFFRG